MTLKKKLHKRYYTDLNDVSVWRWDNLHKENDYIWICKGNYKPDSNAQGVYMSLIYQFDLLNLDNLKERTQIVLQVIDLITSIDESKISIEELQLLNVFLRALMINPNEINLDVVSKVVKNTDVKIAISLLKVEQNKLKKESVNQISIYERVAQVSRILNGLSIDIKNTSIVQFIAYENEALKIIRNGQR